MLAGRADRRGRRRSLATAALLAALGVGGTLPIAPAAAGTPLSTPAGDPAASGAPRLTGHPASPSPSPTPSWSFSLPEGATATCAFGPAHALHAPAPCTSPFTGSASVDGRHVLVLQSAGETVTAEYVRDSATAAQLEGPVGPSPDRAPRWQLTLEDGARATCRLDDGPGQPCVGTYTADLTGATPGEHRLEVEAVDEAGNRAVQRRTYLLADAPCSTCNNASPLGGPCSTCNSALAPTLTVQGPVGPSRDADPVFAVTGAAGPVECRLLRGGLPVRAWTPCGGQVRLGLTPQDRDGSYVLQARVAGRGTASSAPYRYDLTPPERVHVEGPDGITAGPPAWTWQLQAGTTSRCTLLRDDAVVAGPLGCAPGATPRPDGDGVHALRVALVDEAGNAGPEASSPEVLVDTAPPPAPGVLVVPSGGAARQALVAADVEPGAATTCREVGPTGTEIAGARGTWSPCALPLTVDLTEVGDGTRIEVRATDGAGGTGPAGSAPLLPPPYGVPVVLAPTGPAALRQVAVGLQTPGAPEELVCRLVHAGSAEPWTPCRDTVPLDLADRRDGAYTLEATGTRSGLTGRATYVLDTQAPLAPLLTVEPARVGSSQVLGWQWREEADVTYRCRLTGPAGTPVLDEACRPGVQADLSGQPDGLWTFALTAVDRAGLSTERTVEHLLDRRVPGLAVAPAAGERQPAWTVSAASDLVPVCTLLRDGAPVRGPEPCGGTYAPDLADQPDGVLQLQVRVTDAAGLTAVHLSDSLLDTRAPALRLGLPATGTDRAPVPDVATDDPTAAVSCRLADRAWQPCGPGVSLDLSAVPDGPVVLQAQATDGAGRTTAASATYLLDTTAPEPVPVRTTSAPRDALPAWAVGEPEQGARLVCTVTTPDGAAGTDCSAPTFSAGPSVADHPLVLAVQAVDAAGNRSSPTAAVTVPDRTAPQLRAPVPGQGPLGRDREPRWTFLAEPGSTVTCTVTRDGAVQRTTPCSSPFALDLEPGAPDGVYGLGVSATDPAGNRSTAAPGSYLLDTSAPAAPVFTAVPAGPSGLPLLRWMVQAGLGDALTCQLLRDGRPLEDPRPCDGTQDLDLRVLDLGEGTYALRTWARDAAGSASPAATSRPYAWVRAGGGLGVRWHTAPEGHLAAATGSWVFSGEAGAVLHCVLLRDGRVVRARSRCDGSYPVPGLDRSGFYTLQVTATQGGVSSSVPSERSFTLELEDPAAPRLTHPLPAAAPDPQVTWSWTSPAGLAVQCRLRRDGAPAGVWTDCPGGSLRAVLPEQGRWRLELRTRARSGRTSPATTSPGYTYDATAPEVPPLRLRAASGTASSTAEAVWAFALPDGTTGRCTVVADGRALVRERSCRDGLVLDVRRRPAGDHVLTVVVADAAGNTATATSVFTLLPPPGRPVGQVSPSDPLPSRPVLPVRAPLAAQVRAAAPVGAAPSARADRRTAPIVPTAPVVPGVPDAAVPSLAALGGATATASGGGAADSAAGAGAPGAPDGRGRHGVPGLPGPLELALRDVLADTLRRPTLPLTLLAVVTAFLLVQNRLDRRDPKLAAAPVASPPPVPFEPAVRGDARDTP